MAQSTLSISVAFDGDAKSIKGLTKSVDGLKKAFEGTFAPIEKSRRGFSRYNGMLDGVTKGMLKLNQTVEGLQNALSGLDAIFASGLSLDTSITDLSALTGVAGEGLAEIEASARSLAKTFGGSAADAVESYKLILSQLGPDIAGTPEALADMGRSVTVLSKTMGGDTVSAAQVLTTAMNQFGVSLDDPMAAAGEMSRMMNVMAAAAQAGSAELPAIKEALEQCGMAAASANVSFEETNAAIQVLDARGRKASEGGVALRNVLATLSQGRFLPAKTLDELEKAGVDVAALSDTTRSFADRLDLLAPLLDDTALLAKLFGKENQNAAMALISSTDRLREYTAAVTDTSSAEEQAAVVMESAAEKMARMQARVDDVKISLMQMAGGLYPVTKAVMEIAVPLAQVIPLITTLTGALRKTVPAAKGFFSALARIPAAIGSALTGTRTYRAALAGLTAALGSARVATIALQTAMSLGLAAVIQGVITLITRLVKKHREAKASVEELTVSEDDYSQALVDARSRMSVLTAELRSFSGSKEEEKAKAEELNATYGNTFGTYQTVAEWYDVLMVKSDDYVKMMTNEAKIRALANKSAEASMKADRIREEMDSTPVTVTKALPGGLGPSQTYEVANPDLAELEAQLTAQKEIVRQHNEEMRTLVEENARIKQGLTDGLPSGPGSVEQGGTGKSPDIVVENPEVTEALEELDAAFAKLKTRNAVFGQSQNNLNDKINATRSAISGVIADGQLSGPVLDALIAKYRELLALKREVNGDPLEPAKGIATPGVESPSLDLPVLKRPDELSETQKDAEGLKFTMDDLYGSLSGVSYAMSSMGNAIGGAAGEWLTYGANALSGIGQTVSAITTLITAIEAKKQADAQGAIVGAANSVASTPFIGWTMALGAIASMTAALLSIPKFAKGGIAYGPTVGMFGEYPGASHNPEVVAPLDKLQNMLQPAGQNGGGEVQFRISGRDLEGVLTKRNNFSRRTS